MTWWRRLIRRRKLERDLDAELRDHIEQMAADGIRNGRSEAEVRREIRLTFGGMDQIKEQCRDVRRPRALADVAADLRFAVRVLVKDRWFTAGAVLALAFAMGIANTAFISAHATELRGLPVDRPDRIVIMGTTTGPGTAVTGGVSYPDFEDWRNESHVLSPMAAFLPATVSLGSDGAVPEQFNANYVSAATFAVLGVRPAMGRDFSDADDRPGAEGVAIIGSGLWKDRYGGRPDIVGHRIAVNNATPATIIGVMPDGFRFHQWVDVWLPLSQMPGPARQNRAARQLFAIGRLPDGVGPDRVRADVSAVAANLAATYPDTNKDIRAWVDLLQVAFNGTRTDANHLMPLVAAALILIVASANLANLLLARAVFRSREIAIRMALGAGRWRIVRQLLIESLLLSCIATMLAVGISWLAVQPSAEQTLKLAPYMHMTIDGRLIMFLGALAFLIAGLFGLAPALYAARRGQADGLKDGGRTSGSRGARRWTHALLVGQFALTLALLTAAGLAVRSFQAVYDMDVDVDTADTFALSMRLPPPKYATPEQRLMFHDQLKARLAAVPGITGSTIANTPPFDGGGRRRLTSVDGRPVSDPPPNIGAVIVEPGYFEMLGVRLVLGTPFSNVDGSPGRETAIVNRRFADTYGLENPIGRRIELQQQQSSSVTATIVGVSPNIRQGQGDVEPIVYLPFRAGAPANVSLIVRGSGGSAHVASITREAASSIDPDLALGAVRSLDEMRDNARFGSTSIALQYTEFGVIALILTSMGLYSVMAYAVTRRTQEIGVRMALGARPADVGWLFLRTSLWIVAGGLILGVPASIAAGRLMQSSIVGALAGDVVTLGVVAGVLVVVALMAALVPASRATRVQPTVALRIE